MAVSSGLLMFRKLPHLSFFIIHPGGPFFRNKHEGAWSIPKGLATDDADLLENAIREFHEETGITPIGPYIPLGSVRMKSGKQIYAWGFEGTWNESQGITSNTFVLEWPPRSGKFIQVPEADKGKWADFEESLVLLQRDQRAFAERLNHILNEPEREAKNTSQ